MQETAPAHRDFIQRTGAYSQKHPLHIVFFYALLIILLIVIHFFVLARHKKQEVLPIPISIIAAQIRTVPVFFSALGTVTPIQIVTVKTQVSGTMTNVFFHDGQYVKKGELLATIDSRPYESQLLEAEGALTRDQALLKNALVDQTRYQNLYQTKSVSEQTLATQQSLVKQYQGAVVIDQGQIQSAKTNLSYTQITSPADGRIGIGIVDAGNFVQPSDTAGLAVITTLNPIYVYFSLPEDDIPEVVQAFHQNPSLRVLAYDRNQSHLLDTGKLVALDNQINIATGTLNFEAEFNNTDNDLFPNQFVNIDLQVNTLVNAVVIPTSAIQQGSQGTYVYRYNPNQTVSLVYAKTSVTSGEDTVITHGISANQNVVTQGADKLIDGATVVVSGKTK